MSEGDPRHQPDKGRRDDEGRFGYWPLRGPTLALLLVLAAATVVFVSVAGFAYERMGISAGWFEAIFIASIVGSRINIPVWQFAGSTTVERVDVVVFGIRYRIPAVRGTTSTTLAVNFGGAVIPTGLSIYLMVHNRIWQHSLVAIACVALVVWLVARPIAGVGIVTPSLIPPVAAALAAVIIGKPALAALAYICGTIGTLVGADLVNVPRIRSLGAPEASIGGAGTFDGIFLSGILAVIIASL